MKALKKLMRKLATLAVLAGLVGGGYYAYTYYNAEEVEEGLGELPTVVAEVRDITVSVSATGVLEPIRIVEVKSRASGEILEMPVAMGDIVERGQLLVQDDTRILDQEFKQADADLQWRRGETRGDRGQADANEEDAHHAVAAPAVGEPTRGQGEEAEGEKPGRRVGQQLRIADTPLPVQRQGRDRGEDQGEQVVEEVPDVQQKEIQPIPVHESPISRLLVLRSGKRRA